jgi:hypothetical protein
MPVDPFLFFHKVSEFHINIGGRWSPLSIRDQMLRGRWAAERAMDLLGGDRPLAVIGAGAGGVTAAITAVNAGIATTLFEKEHDPFSRHASCRRWVDPTQYDWPLDHYPQGQIPWPGTPPVQLSWPNAGRAIALVGDWRAQFQAFLLSPNATAFFTMRRDTEVVNVHLNSAGTMAGVEWRPAGKRATTFTPFGLVITAMGFGDERSYLTYPPGHVPAVHPFRGYPFWSDDPFEHPHLSRTPRPDPPRILISGGGDGALQDFLRIVTHFKSARDLWDYLPLSPFRRARLQKDAQDIEDQANRALIWSGKSDHDHVALSRLMADFQRLAANIYGMRQVPTRLDRAIRYDFRVLWFVHPCSHFTPGYALNRLLVLLLMLRLRERSVGFVYRPNHRLVEVECNHPPGPLDPATCHWQPHRAVFWAKPDCQRDSPGTFPPPPPLAGPAPPDQIEQEFDVIVMRHGIAPPPQLWNPASGAALPPTRQLLPYHYPG